MTVKPTAAATAASDPTDSGGAAAARAAAERVLRIEAAALIQLAEGLDGRFAAAVEVLLSARGRVVVTGIGKSGHVARKIAATLASTGTPSFFVHPSEASHGDLGMVARDDVVLALSNSGGTAELADIVAYAKRFRLSLIGITSRAPSPLADQADITLLLPDAAEACPMGLAPTTSTTLMLALGDALAVALLERRGFSAEQFRVFHPGGSLGRRLVKVADIMHEGDSLPLVGPDTRMADALLVMTAKSFGCVGVRNAAGRLIGIITDGDLRRHMADDLLDRSAGDIMTPNPKAIRANALAEEALAIMNLSQRPVTSLFVTEDDGRPIGILNVHDCLRAGIA
ncbi:MAG TPA: KpsF/GutQ family sugar-phosphate isomerase [Alphaproteobacteria bacterium]|nr:KpsF/GutQ family sugar-phosphate isomerase [Alphaproteobacteria bacterium]